MTSARRRASPTAPALARSRAGRVLALVLGALVAAGMFLGAGHEPAPQPVATDACTLPAPTPTLVPGSLALPPHPHVLILGDSYTEGYGAEPESQGWAHLVGRPLGWTVTLNGFGGTGYVNRGPQAAGTYVERLPALAGRSFDLVVVQGGSNDRDTPYPALQAAVARTLDAVRAEFPRAAVLILGPSNPYGRADPTRVLVRCVLVGYAAQQHLTLIDPVVEHWFVDGDGERYANPANGHPSNAGHRLIASRFEADLRVLAAPPQIA